MTDVSFKTAYDQPIHVEVRMDNRRITAASITGSFHMSPPEAVTEIEKALVGASPEDGALRIAAKVGAAMKKTGADCAGFSAGDLVKAVMKVMS